MGSISILNKRISEKPSKKILNAHTLLRHFSIITYLVDEEKLKQYIPDYFDIYIINVKGKPYGMVSAVTFIDKDFHLPNFFPFWKEEFPQTNYRAYVVEKKTGEKCAWFFGTALGSSWVAIPKKIWKMPWFYSEYDTTFDYKNRYQTYKVNIKAPAASAFINIVEDDEIKFNTSDFASEGEAILVLTHPVTGYFHRTDKQMGQYKIWHPKMKIRTATCIDAYFEKFEVLGLLDKQEMKKPYSVLLTNEIEFIIELPPHKICT